MGIIIPIVPRRRFEYTFLAPSAAQSVTLAPSVEVFKFHYAHLFVRVHERSMVANQSYNWSLYYTLPSDEDSREFTDTSGAITSVTVTSSAPSATPGLVHREFANLGAHLKLVLTANQSSAGGTLYAEMSAALVLREA